MNENNVEELIKIRDMYLVKSIKESTYYITKDKTNKTYEMVCLLNCVKENALKVFHLMIKEQQNEIKVGLTQKWRTLRLFDRNGKQIAQES